MRPTDAETAYIVLVDQANRELGSFSITGIDLDFDLEDGLVSVGTDDDEPGEVRLMIIPQDEE